LDFLNGLYAGKLDGHGPERLEILYIAFRHKIAHLSFPLAVFNTATRNEFKTRKHRLVTWKVNATKRDPPIDLIDFVPARLATRSKTPWNVKYTCRVIVSVRSFEIDIIKSIYGKTGYLHHLEKDPNAQERFAKCMKVLFPP
jgi:hypothetical protein